MDLRTINKKEKKEVKRGGKDTTNKRQKIRQYGEVKGKIDGSNTSEKRGREGGK